MKTLYQVLAELGRLKADLQHAKNAQQWYAVEAFQQRIDALKWVIAEEKLDSRAKTAIFGTEAEK